MIERVERFDVVVVVVGKLDDAVVGVMRWLKRSNLIAFIY